jgi:signal transduction histidine kinase
MSKLSHKKFLTAQLAETKRLLSFVEDDILMSFSLKQKISELESDLIHYRNDFKEPKVR